MKPLWGRLLCLVLLVVKWYPPGKTSGQDTIVSAPSFSRRTGNSIISTWSSMPCMTPWGISIKFNSKHDPLVFLKAVHAYSKAEWAFVCLFTCADPLRPYSERSTTAHYNVRTSWPLSSMRARQEQGNFEACVQMHCTSSCQQCSWPGPLSRPLDESARRSKCCDWHNSLWMSGSRWLSLGLHIFVCSCTHLLQMVNTHLCAVLCQFVCSSQRPESKLAHDNNYRFQGEVRQWCLVG